MARRIPNLTQLKAFEAAARLGSFRDAGEELSVTHSAVSHQIKALETDLGATLFHRQSRGVRLTDAATALFDDVRQALDLLASTTAQFRNSGLAGTLTVSVAPSFATRWLLKRLDAFQVRFPAVDTTVEIAAERQDFERTGIDLAIRHGEGEWRGLASEKLFDDTLWLVGSTRTITAIQDRHGHLDLGRTRLLSASGRRHEWSTWFTETGVAPVPDERRFITYPTQALALDGAATGLGLALADHRLVEDEIAEGRLARVTGHAVSTGHGFYLVRPRRAALEPRIAAFREWLFAELGKAGARNA